MTALVRTRALRALAIAAAGAALVALTFALAPLFDARRAAAERDDHANLLLITIDTLRPDRLGCGGNPRARTPNLDALAESGVLFETTIASAPSTAPSHATIMTALSPRAHGALANGQTLSEGVITLAERLRAEGYATGAVVSAAVLAPRTGLDRGFDAYIRAYERPGRKNEVSTAESTFTRVLPWLREHASERFFLWVHLYDPHQPYEAPGVLGAFADPSYTGRLETWEEMQILSWNRLGTIPARDARHLTARYDAEVTYVDAQIGQFLRALDETGALGRTLVCVTADHGETLGEHAGYSATCISSMTPHCACRSSSAGPALGTPCRPGGSCRAPLGSSTSRRRVSISCGFLRWSASRGDRFFRSIERIRERHRPRRRWRRETRS